MNETEQKILDLAKQGLTQRQIAGHVEMKHYDLCKIIKKMRKKGIVVPSVVGNQKFAKKRDFYGNIIID